MMRRYLPTLALLLAVCGHAAADSQRAQAEYTITSVLRILNPVDPAAMTDEFQTARVLTRDADSATVEITYRPLHRQTVGEDPNWRADDAAMTEYLAPTPTENWDAPMRDALLAELKVDGIDPDALTDRQLVTQVSQWAMRRARTTDAFAIWDIYYPKGIPTVYPALRPAFDAQKPDKTWTDAQVISREALGKSMFYDKVHGSCTSSAIYLTTIFRALGLPTRIVVCIPPFDPNDDAQAQKFYAAVHHNAARETVRAALDGSDGFANHLFNEVYLAHRWVRLNYDTLGQPILDSHYFGLLTHIATCRSVSDLPLAQTWGLRYAKYPDVAQPRLSSVNPYQLLSVRDSLPPKLPNPPAPLAELRAVTVTTLYPASSSALPAWVGRDTIQATGTDFFLGIREWVPGSYNQMRAFEKRAGHDFLLHAPGHPDLRTSLCGFRVSRGDGAFQAFGAKIAPDDRAKLVPGVAYRVRPINTSPVYRWTVAPGATLTL